jgi:hypothetical protein
MKVLIGRLEKWKKSKVDVVAHLWHHCAQISIEGPTRFLDHEQVTIKGVNGSMTVRLTNARRFKVATGSDSRDFGVVQQLREAFPFGSAPRFLIFDRDGKYGLEVPAAVRSLNMRPVRTSFESPWQNGVAERWIESCRRDLLDHIMQ